MKMSDEAQATEPYVTASEMRRFADVIAKVLHEAKAALSEMNERVSLAEDQQRQAPNTDLLEARIRQLEMDVAKARRLFYTHDHVAETVMVPAANIY